MTLQDKDSRSDDPKRRRVPAEEGRNELSTGEETWKAERGERRKWPESVNSSLYVGTIGRKLRVDYWAEAGIFPSILPNAFYSIWWDNIILLLILIWLGNRRILVFSIMWTTVPVHIYSQFMRDPIPLGHTIYCSPFNMGCGTQLLLQNLSVVIRIYPDDWNLHKKLVMPFRISKVKATLYFLEVEDGISFIILNRTVVKYNIWCQMT